MSDNNSNLAVGAGVGTIAGLSAGMLEGAKKAKQIVKTAQYNYVKPLVEEAKDNFVKAVADKTENSYLKSIVDKAKDAYVTKRVQEQFELNGDKIQEMYKGNRTKIAGIYSKIAEAAQKNFDNASALFKAKEAAPLITSDAYKKATEDFAKSEVCKNTVKQAKAAKVKLIAAIAAVGTAIGIGIAAIINKIKSNKAE